jgi:hypothetical protein
MKSKSMRLFLLALPGLAFACQPTVTQRMSGTAGTNGSAGVSGTAGSGAAGSAAGTSGAAGDTGAAGDGTAGVGAAGSSAGTSGAAGTGGTTGAAGSDGGTADGAAGATGAAGDTITSVLGIKNANQNFVADSFILFPCYMNSGQDCITNKPGTQCPSNTQPGKPFEEQGLVIDQDFTIGGTKDKLYTATIQVNGVSEGKYYMGGTRAAGELDPPNANSDMGTDTFYTGGQPVAQENYNVYSIRVKDSTGAIKYHYYLNSFPKTNTAYETHTTFAISYKHDITVVGGGTITYHSADFNCHAIDNCGSGYRTVTCAVGDGRKVPNEPNLVVPTTYLGEPVSAFNPRNGAAQPFHSHIIHITVTDLKAM